MTLRVAHRGSLVDRMNEALGVPTAYFPGPMVVLVHEGWDLTPYLATQLRNGGCGVHMLTASDDARDVLPGPHLGPGITEQRVPGVHSDGYVEALDMAVGAYPSAVVLALTEAILSRIWAANPAWSDRVFPHVDPWQRQLLQDKSRLSAYVAARGVRVPPEHAVRCVEDLRDGLRKLGLPAVLKGTTGVGGSRVRVVQSEAEALQAFGILAAAGPCFLQQFVDGPTYVVGGLFHEGEPLRLYAGEVLECDPPVTGPSIRLRSTQDSALLEQAIAAARALRCSGLVGMNLMQNRDGRYSFIELNPRPWGSIGAAETAAVNLFTPFIQMLRGQTVNPRLSCVDGVESGVHPKLAMNRLRGGGLTSLGRLATDPKAWLDAPWRDPRLMAYWIRRLRWHWQSETLRRQ